MLIKNKTKNALVASGGGLKALFFHIGVGMRLENQGLIFNGGLLKTPRTELLPPNEVGTNSIDMLVGSSGGCLFTMGPAFGYSARDMYNLFMDDRALKKAGLARGIHKYVNFNTQAVTELIKGVTRAIKNGLNIEAISVMSPLYLGKLQERLHNFLLTEDYTRVGADLFTVTTPLNQTGRIVYCRLPHQSSFSRLHEYFDSDEYGLLGSQSLLGSQREQRIVYRNDADLSATIAASCSLQIFQPYCVTHKNGDKIDLVDGETRKTLSYKIASDNGADLVFISYTHVPYRFDNTVGSIKKFGMTRVAIQSIYLMIEEKILASRELNRAKNMAYDVVDEGFDELIAELPEHRSILEQHRRRILKKLVVGLGIKRSVDYIFIKPDQNDSDFYFEWHLGMGKAYIERIVQKGYEAADKALKGINIEFNDRKAT
ncbi:MAG: hypothetical protein ABIG89_03565 [Candidatus Woesearchaeota archaeon]